MAYTPNNVQVYLAAYSGAMAGMGASGRAPVSQVASDYNTLSAIAGAFAQEFDTIYRLSGNTLDLELIGTLSQNLYSGRYAGNLNPTDYEGMARVLLAMLTSADTYVSGQIGPIPSPGGAINSFLRARGAVYTKVDTTSFQTRDYRGSNDGITYKQGDVVMLIGEFDNDAPDYAVFNGPWVVGIVAEDGTAPLSRPAEWPNGAVRHPGDISIMCGSEGAFFANTEWRAMGPATNGQVTAPGDIVIVGIDDPGFYAINLTVNAEFFEGTMNLYLPVYSYASSVTVMPFDMVTSNTTTYLASIMPGDWIVGSVRIEAYTSEGTLDTTNSGPALVSIINQRWFPPGPR
jgi:hypothetical protein